MPTISLTTDAVIFAEKDKEIVVLLIQRKNEPYQGKWALPGGFLEQEETLETGCRRELKEETGLAVNTLEQVGVYDAVNRDPRGRMISVAFTTRLTNLPEVKGSDDATKASWIALHELEALAFDHAQIIADAAKHLKLQIP